MNVLTAILIACIAVLLTIIFFLTRKKPDGYIVINKSDPMKDTYTLALDIPFGELDNRKDVTFQIKHE